MLFRLWFHQKQQLNAEKVNDKIKSNNLFHLSKPQEVQHKNPEAQKQKQPRKLSATFQKAPEKNAVFKNLAITFFLGETIFKKKVCKNPSVLTYAVKATVVDFYCSDIISVKSPSVKDKHIIWDERGCKVRDKNEI